LASTSSPKAFSGKQQTKTRKALEYFAKIARAEQA
jgi:hypothetical protein